MRVLLITPAYVPAVDYGGPVVKVESLAGALLSLGHDPIVWTADFDIGRGRVPWGTRNVGDVTVQYFRRVGAYHWSPIVPQVLVAAARTNSDIVHCFGMRDGLTQLAAISLRRCMAPYVVEPLGMHSAVVRGIARKRVFDRLIGHHYIDGAAGLIATSKREQHELHAATTQQVWLRYNPISAPIATGSGVEARAAAGIPSDAPLVGWVGRISRSKGLDLLVHAVGQLPGVHLALAGPDDRDGALQRLKRAINAAGNGDRVHLVGPVWGVNKARFLAALDVFALPSLTENFGNAAAEAAAIGLRVVLSDQCGAAELLHRFGAATVVRLDARELRDALAAELETRFRTPGGRNEASAARVRRALSPEGTARRQVEIYESALGAMIRRRRRS